MTLKERIALIFDVFSRRERARGQQYKPDDISARVRAHVILFYRDFVNGRNRPYSSEDYTYDFWEQMHNKLEHLHGRVHLSNTLTANPGEDVLEFVQSCNADEFFDFIEL